MPRTPLEPFPEIPYLSILDADGNVDRDLEPDVPEEDLRRLYETMVLVRAFDERRLKLQRQGRIGTFAPVKGQEAAQLGSVYPLRQDDWVVPAFREAAALAWRGMQLEDDLLYAAGFEEGFRVTEEGRDLPIAIPIASQCCHAMGIAWGRKLQGFDEVAIVYFGDGATSHGDFHEPMNFAQVFKAPVIFLCQNNQYAISVPRRQQTASPTIAQKAVAYGMPSMQVDGNDILAMIAATREAVERARAGAGPTLIEAVTYRLSVHTTADDPTKYRSDEEVETWLKRDPILRFRTYLEARGILKDGDHDRISADAEERVTEAVKRFEERREELEKDVLAMFDHLMSERPAYLEKQREMFERGFTLDENGTLVPKGGA